MTNKIAPEILEMRTVEICNLALAGRTKPQIAKQFGISNVRVGQILRSKKAEKYLAEVQEEAKKEAISYVRHKLSKLAPKATDALERLLRKDNVKGVEIVFKGLGVLEAEQGEQNATLNVILPRGVAPKEEKSVEVEVKKDESGT